VANATVAAGSGRHHGRSSECAFGLLFRVDPDLSCIACWGRSAFQLRVWPPENDAFYSPIPWIAGSIASTMITRRAHRQPKPLHRYHGPERRS
jgi:hypothetical protein